MAVRVAALGGRSLYFQQGLALQIRVLLAV
jgi:hypothetical protein